MNTPHKPDGMTGASGKLTEAQVQELDSFLDDLTSGEGKSVVHRKDEEKEEDQDLTNAPSAR